MKKSSVQGLFSTALLALGVLAVVTVPTVTFAQDSAPSTKTLGDILTTATSIATLAVPTAAVLMLFFWAMWQVISNSGDPEKLKKARSKIVWGIVVLFALFSLGGIIAILQMSFFERVL